MQTIRMGIFGQSGSGKTTLAKSMIKPKDVKRLIVFDPEDEYDDCGLTDTAGLNDLIAKIRASKGGFRLRYVPPGVPAHRVDALNKLSAIAIRLQSVASPAPLLVLVDELHLAYGLHETKCPHFAELNTGGRKKNIAIVGISQRIANVGMDFRTQLTDSAVFSLTDANDVKAGAQLGYKPEMIESLSQFQYLTKKDGKIVKKNTKA